MIGDYDRALHADVVLSFVRADGMTVNLHRADGYFVAVWMPGNKLARPLDLAMPGEIPVTFFLRRCAEPVSIPSALAADIRGMLTGMRGVKATERAAFDRAIADGAASLLMIELRNLSTRKGGSHAPELALRVEGVRAKALADLPATLRADLDAIVTAQKARAAARREARS